MQTHPGLDNTVYRKVHREVRELYMAEEIKKIIEKNEYGNMKFIGIVGIRHVRELQRRLNIL